MTMQHLGNHIAEFLKLMNERGYDDDRKRKIR